MQRNDGGEMSTVVADAQPAPSASKLSFSALSWIRSSFRFTVCFYSGNTNLLASKGGGQVTQDVQENEPNIHQRRLFSRPKMSNEWILHGVKSFPAALNSALIEAMNLESQL